jgi:hypothetical protein
MIAMGWAFASPSEAGPLADHAAMNRTRPPSDEASSPNAAFLSSPSPVAQILNGSPAVRALEATRQLLGTRSRTAPRAPVQRREENRTGLPDALKAGAERLSGMALDDVRVHRNSSRPAQLQALAFAQGADIHLAPGEEHHLPHETWHVVQQKQGRVAATMQLKGISIND